MAERENGQGSGRDAAKDLNPGSSLRKIQITVTSSNYRKYVIKGKMLIDKS